MTENNKKKYIQVSVLRKTHEKVEAEFGKGIRFWRCYKTLVDEALAMREARRNELRKKEKGIEKIPITNEHENSLSP